MLSSPYIFHLSKCKTTSCVYSQLIFFVCLCLSWLCRKDAKADACAWGMEKGSACLPLSHTHAAISVGAGEGGGGSDG